MTRLKLLLWETFRLRLFGAMKVPLLNWCLPTITRLDEGGCAVRIPLRKRTKNHLGSMYFGALCVGADCAGGLLAYRAIQKSGKRVSLIFKNFRAEFLRRAEGDVEFRCDQGQEIHQLVERVLQSPERQELTVRVEAWVLSQSRERSGSRSKSQPQGSENEHVATFELTISLKNQDLKKIA